MANYTETYKLQKPLQDEFYDVSVQNDNMDKIEAGLVAHDTALQEQKKALDNKADLNSEGKIPIELLPSGGYDEQEIAKLIEEHNEDETAHPFLVDQIGTCVTAAKNAQEAADAALKALSQIANTIDVLPTQNGSLTYTGAEQTPTWNSFNTDTLTLGGTTSGTDAGEYTATFTPKDGYQWSDGGTSAKSVIWTIGRASMPIPTQSGSLTYTGSEQSPTWNNYDSSKMTLGGITTGSNAGSYDAIFTPNVNYKWNDGITTAKTVAWSIGKAAGSMILSKTSLALTASTISDSFTVTRPGDGVVMAVSNNSEVASVAVSGTTVTVTAIGKGDAVITVSVGAGTNYTAPANKTCAVTVTMPTENMADNDWSTIKDASDSGDGANYWSVGDVKAVSLSGTIGILTLSNLSVNVFIIGFNHNAAREGNNRIHFLFGKINGTNVAFCDSKYNSAGSDVAFRMNLSNTNSGGWNSSYMRKTILGNSNTPTNPLAGSFMAALPADLRAIMKSVTKYSDNTGGGSNTASYVTATTDYMFLLAEFEVYGTRTYANSAEQNYQKQYAYFAAGNSKIAYNHSAVATAVWWWLRSVYYNTTASFLIVYTGGGISYGTANGSGALRPGFAA